MGTSFGLPSQRPKSREDDKGDAAEEQNRVRDGEKRDGAQRVENYHAATSAFSWRLPIAAVARMVCVGVTGRAESSA